MVLHTFRVGERCHLQLPGLGGAAGARRGRAGEASPRRTLGAETQRCHLYGSLGDQATIGPKSGPSPFMMGAIKTH